MHNLWAIFDAVADGIGDRPAIRWRGREWSYRDIHARASRFANVLAANDLGHHHDRSQLEGWEIGQDTVATYLLNGPEYMEVTLGAYAARAAPFNVNYRYVADELTYLLDNAASSAVVFHSRFAPTLDEVLPRLDRRPLLLQVADESGNGLVDGAFDYEAALAGASPLLAVGGHDPDDLYVLYTGGTTGMPKGTLWRQADIWTAALAGDLADVDTLSGLAGRAAAAEPTTFLPNAPFMHGAAHWLALRTLLAGGTLVINAVVDQLDPTEVWDTVESERINAMLMVGESFVRPLLSELAERPRDTSSLQLLVVGGAATSAETKRAMLDALPGVLVLDAAGASETGSALSTLSMGDDEGENAMFSIGPNAAILDATLGHVEEPGHATPGWLATRGAIPLGYLGDAAKTAATFPVVDGVRWSVPGDLARLRPDGKVELLGRESATINTGGEKVFAEEVEAALLTHPEVVDVTVVGRDSERWGQEVVAVLSVRDGSPVTDEELVDAAGARIARYKLPKAIVRVPAVLRSPAGKADYRWAREQASLAR